MYLHPHVGCTCVRALLADRLARTRTLARRVEGPTFCLISAILWLSSLTVLLICVGDCLRCSRTAKLWSRNIRSDFAQLLYILDHTRTVVSGCADTLRTRGNCRRIRRTFCRHSGNAELLGSRLSQCIQHLVLHTDEEVHKYLIQSVSQSLVQ